jgi:hypothetical protein
MNPIVLVADPFRMSGREREPGSDCLPDAVDALDAHTIADLPRTKILEMNRDELVRMIRNSHLPFLSEETSEHLAFHDRQTLERLASLAQRCCFYRMARSGSFVGNTTDDRPTFDA